MTEKQKYASDWDKSADDFVKQDIYNKLSETISSYPIVFEIGCGTGQSTLSLLENGHGVICIEQNDVCLAKAKERISDTPYKIIDNPANLKQGEVCFILGDVTDFNLLNQVLPTANIDAVICWNMGTYWDRERNKDIILQLSAAGFDKDYILGNTVSAFVELIIDCAHRIAKFKSCPLHIVERRQEEMTLDKDEYYVGLKDIYGFSDIEYINIPATTLSSSGRKMIANGRVIEKDVISIVVNAILIK